MAECQGRVSKVRLGKIAKVLECHMERMILPQARGQGAGILRSEEHMILSICILEICLPSARETLDLDILVWAQLGYEQEKGGDEIIEIASKGLGD